MMSYITLNYHGLQD